MIKYRENEILIVDGLQNFLKSKGYNCPVIMANQTAPTPPYPYIAYTIITPVSANMKGYSVANDGMRYKSMVQTWSFTAQSNDDVEAFDVLMLAYNWFALIGNTHLSDNNIVAQRVGGITNRDNLLTIEYEHRYGFDVDFLLLHTLEKADCETAGYIETADINVIEEV